MIIKEQFILSRRANISISESNDMADFERDAYLNLLLEAEKAEAESMKS